VQPLRISLIRSHKKGAVRTHVGDLFLDPLKRGESTQKARVVALRCMPQCRCAALHDCDCACSSWTLTTIWWPRAGSCVGVQFPPASSRLILRQPTGPAYRIQPGVPHTTHRPWPVRASATVKYVHAAIAAAAAAYRRRVLPPRIAIRRTPRGEWPTECRGALCTAGAPRGRCLQPSVHTRGAPDSGGAASPGAVRERCAQWLAVAPSAGFAEEEWEWGIMGKPNGDGCGCGGGSFGR
jgi:hypothetical protein